MSLTLEDEPWRIMGFRRRPKYGAFFQRFRPAWRVGVEKSIFKEMLILFTAAHITAGVLARDEIEDLVRVYAGGPDGSRDLWRTLGYASRTQAEAHFRESIGIYLDAWPHGWLQLLPTRLGALALQDRTLAARLTVGAIKLAQRAEDLVLGLRSRA